MSTKHLTFALSQPTNRVYILSKMSVWIAFHSVGFYYTTEMDFFFLFIFYFLSFITHFLLENAIWAFLDFIMFI